MPNHVTNEISVIGGSNKQRLAFIRAITNMEKVRFSGAIPRRYTSTAWHE